MSKNDYENLKGSHSTTLCMQQNYFKAISTIPASAVTDIRLHNIRLSMYHIICLKILILILHILFAFL